MGRFWATVTRALHDPIRAGVFRKNEVEHFIEIEGTEQRLKAKTAWNADSLRGDYADVLIFDEWQLVNEDAWGLVGAPMLLDTDGDAVFIYTPPSLRSRSVSKADDPQHAAKLFKKAQALQDGGSTRWAAFHFSSMDNPYLSREALDEISGDMTSLAYRMEILAEDIDEAPGALWTRKTIEDNRVIAGPHYSRIVVSLDPSATSGGDDAGIVVCGKAQDHGYVIADETVQGSPLVWARAAVIAFHKHKADLIVAEKNQGGEMVELTIRQVDPNVPVKLVHASRGKQARAEPVSAKAEKGFIHHVGAFPQLEDELCIHGDTWITTENGLKRAKIISPGDRVLTRYGFQSVLASGVTNTVTELIKIRTKNGRHLLTTVHHPIYNKFNGFIHAKNLEKNDILEVNRLWHTNHSESTNTVRRLSSMVTDGLLQEMGTTKTGKEGSSIDMSGKDIMDRFLKKLMSTIKMEISSIMTFPIWKLQPESDMSLTIQGIDGLMLKKKGFPSLERKSGRRKSQKSSNVLHAEESLKVPEQEPCFANRLAGEDTIQSIEAIDCQPTPVYNLHVENYHEYYANGVLVHNCLWIPGDDSPNRLDAMVWGMTELILKNVADGWDFS